MIIYKFYKDKDENCYKANIVEAKRRGEQAKVLHDMSIIFEEDTITKKGFFSDITRVSVLCHQVLRRNGVNLRQPCVFVAPAFTDDWLEYYSRFRNAAQKVAHQVHETTPVAILNEPEGYETNALSERQIDIITKEYAGLSFTERLKEKLYTRKKGKKIK